LININKLKGKIVERGMSVGTLAPQVGIDKATFYRKLQNGGEDFTIREVGLIVDALELNLVEANDIFFTQLVS